MSENSFRPKPLINTKGQTFFSEHKVGIIRLIRHEKEYDSLFKRRFELLSKYLTDHNIRSLRFELAQEKQGILK